MDYHTFIWSFYSQTMPDHRTKSKFSLRLNAVWTKGLKFSPDQHIFADLVLDNAFRPNCPTP